MVGKRKNNFYAWLYLSPVLILMAVFTFYPLIDTIIISFTLNYNQLTLSGTGFGLDNYLRVLQYHGFKTALLNTAIITFVSVPISVVISLLIAVGLNSIKFLRNTLQTIFFLPYITNTIAIGMVFAVMFDDNFGLINSIIGIFGVDPVAWLAGTYWQGMFVIIVYTLWSAMAFKILIFTAGLQNIGKQYYEAAKVDGTPRGRVLRKITVPLLSPTIAYVVMTSFIASFKVYASIVAIYGEKMGPDSSNRYQTLVGIVYKARTDLRLGVGVASAGAMILFVIILIFTFINFQISKRKVHY